MKIAFYQTAFLGDLLLAVPTLKRIKAWQPEAELTLICRSGLSALMSRMPFIDRVVEVNKKDDSSIRELVRVLKATKYDYYFSPHYSFRSHFLSLKVKAEYKVGFQYWWNFPFFTNRIHRPMHLPDALRQMSLLMPFDRETRDRLQPLIDNDQAPSQVEDWASMTLPKEFWAQQKVDELPSLQSPFVCLAPGSVWPTKRWTAKGFAEVGRYYTEQGYKIIILGSPDEADLCKEVARATGGISYAGELSLWQSVLVLSRAQLLISNDSGAQHMASLAGTPTVSVFGPTVLGLGYRPWQNQSKVVEQQLDCRPCGKHGHQRCPIGTHECMKSITAREVIDAATPLLRQ